MTDITRDIIKAVISRVRAAVPAVSNRVYVFPPQGLQFPYIGMSTLANDLGAKEIDHFEMIITFHIFAQNDTDSAVEQCQDIGKLIFDDLNDTPSLTLDDGDFVAAHFDGFQQLLPEDEGKTCQMVARYKFLASD